ncbi:carbohydrate-binding protein [Streptomyces zagrosensis]|uniref:Streptogrisin C n=1 Tax=Streptomyces zagrosensis TaxID=1042984 RepID=A0A7W9UYQ8_9ACTN|nr:carbohydrate-binding protein [Streptomyces zagrosensis]MBB5936210.1 streptogrisin C [Streptomyces zagrosensis]
MPHRHATIACAAAAAVGALALSLLPGTASARPADQAAPSSAAATLRVADTSPVVLAAMQRDLGLSSPAQAKQRLINEADAGAIAGRLQQSLGGDFAGAWVSGADSATLTVATADRSELAAITAKGARAKLVPHTLAELDAAKAKLDRAAVKSGSVDAPIWSVDVRSNTVVIHAVKKSAAQKLISASGVNSDLVRVESTTERPRPLYDIRGGDAYYMNGSGRCSVGFAITRGTTEGFATAGHCGRAGTTTTGFNQVSQGSFQASTFPGRDTAWVATNSNWKATPFVASQGQNVQVAGSTQSAVGASICRSGSTTGWHCGTITRHNTSVTYPEGTISGVTQTTVCAEPGDSGGSYISGSQAQGVTSGGSGDCRSGGTTFHQPINPLIQGYGLTLKTTTDGPGPGPGPGEGTWAAGTVYKAGDQVTYNGGTYRCIQPHQAQPGWDPVSAPALWQRV